MKCSNPIVVMNDKAVDITIYILGGISIVLSLAMGLAFFCTFEVAQSFSAGFCQ
jgi:hypothetical protein